MSRDPNAGLYSRLYAAEFTLASRILEPLGGQLLWARDDYVAFRYRDRLCCIAFYPHKTSASNYHIRVRSQASIDQAHARELMLRLKIGAGHSCTFSQKGDNATIEAESAFARKHNLTYGWATQEEGIPA